MKLHQKFKHHVSHMSYWGERPRVGLRVNFGEFKPGEKYDVEPLHYHQTRTTYICVLDGSVVMEVDGREIVVTPEAMLEIEPLEKYRVVRVGEEGCKLVIIGSHDEDDRVVV